MFKIMGTISIEVDKEYLLSEMYESDLLEFLTTNDYNSVFVAKNLAEEELWLTLKEAMTKYSYTELMERLK
jgi:hypothetical protein